LYILFDHSKEKAEDKIMCMSLEKTEILSMKGYFGGGSRELEIVEKDLRIDLLVMKKEGNK
jgi:hypothetical protein